MKKELLLGQLEDLAGKMGIKIRYEKVVTEDSSLSGGLCRLRGEYVLIIHFGTPLEEKIKIILGALRTFPIGDIYMKPVIRRLLEESQ